MKWQAFDIELSKADMQNIANRYHIDADKKSILENVYDILKAYIHVSAYYEIIKDYSKENTGKIAACITLGKSLDDILNYMSENKQIEKQYMAECISNEVLFKSYDIFSGFILKKYNYNIIEYIFPGDKINLRSIKEIESVLATSKIEISDKLVITPSKSVLFYAVFNIEACTYAKVPSSVICQNCSHPCH